MEIQPYLDLHGDWHCLQEVVRYACFVHHWQAQVEKSFDLGIPFLGTGGVAAALASVVGYTVGEFAERT